MKALIILKNSGSTGKSQTLEYLTKHLGMNGDVISKNYHYNGHDFAAIAKHHGFKIGIITIGDPGAEEFVFTELENLYRNGCDVIVASSRSRSSDEGVYKTLWKFGKEHGMATMETSPYRTYDGYHDSLCHETINDMCANGLLGAINYFLNLKS